MDRSADHVDLINKILDVVRNQVGL